MILQIADVIAQPDLDALREVMCRHELLECGKKTAGWRARPGKNNRQAVAGSPLVRGALRKVEAALNENRVFQSAARPKSIVKLLLSRYDAGMAYAAHVDDALMEGQRTDLSFTLFLSEPESYEGGALVIERTEGERSFKPPAGHLVLYPSTTLHWVEPIPRGVRMAAVGWIRSLIREAAQRELLFDLDQVVEQLRQGGSRERALDLTLKIRSNLLRAWLED